MTRGHGRSVGRRLRSLRGLARRPGCVSPLFFFFLTYIYYFFIPYGEKDNSDILQVKYFKEKRVMEYNRDKTIERIKQEDAATKAQGRPN